MKRIRNKTTGDTYDYLGYRYVSYRRGTDTEFRLKEVYAYNPDTDRDFKISRKDWTINYEYVKI